MKAPDPGTSELGVPELRVRGLGAPELGAQARALASVRDGPAPRRAAERLLESPDPDAAIDDLYPLLIWHKCLGHALAHLDRAGGDLANLSLSRRRFLSTFPVRGRRLWTLADELVDDRVPLEWIGAVLARHKRYLGDAVAELVGEGSGGLALLSGRALEALYPEYAERMEFDSDLLAPDIDSGLAALEALDRLGYSLRMTHVRGGGESCEAAAEKRRRGHSVTVGIEMVRYGPLGLPIGDRLRGVRWRGLSLRAPSAGDLLLMAAARARAQRSLQWIAVNDAIVVLARDGAALDWERLGSSSRAEGLQVHLALLLETAESSSGETLVPAAARRLMAPIGHDADLLRRARRLELWTPRSTASTSTAGLAGRRLSHRTRRRAADSRWRPRGVWRGVLARLVYRLELRLARALPAPLVPLTGLLTHLRPGLGSLCELRVDPLDREAPFCLCGRRRPGRGLDGVRAIADRLPGPGRRPHDCYRYEFRL